MKTLDDYEYDYFERMAIMTESGEDEEEAHTEAIWQVRRQMFDNGLNWVLEPRIMGLKVKWVRTTRVIDSGYN